MTDTKLPETARNSLSGDLLYAARYYLGGRIGLIVVAAAALGLGAYSNWGWLVAAGLAPLFLTVLPCAAMCAVGLCMGGRSKSQSDEVTSSPGSGEESSETSSLRLMTQPGENDEDTSSVSSQPAQAKPRNRKDCC